MGPSIRNESKYALPNVQLVFHQILPVIIHVHVSRIRYENESINQHGTGMNL